MKPLVTNIQRFCVHDGPGIRTTVFFKGCSLHCPWCANPENIEFGKELFYRKNICSDKCKNKNICNAYKTGIATIDDFKICNFFAIGIYGKPYTNDELFMELIKDKSFYGNEGGVTFSGGEPLLFIQQYEETIDLLHKENINLCVETSLCVNSEQLAWACEHIDFFYVDIKILCKDRFYNIVGGDLEQYMRNMELLFKNIEANNIIFRVPLIYGVTYEKENLDALIKLICKYKPKCIQIFSVHNLAETKYSSLGRDFIKQKVVDETEITQLQTKIEKSCNITVQINRI